MLSTTKHIECSRISLVVVLQDNAAASLVLNHFDLGKMGGVQEASDEFFVLILDFHQKFKILVVRLVTGKSKNS